MSNSGHHSNTEHIEARLELTRSLNSLYLSAGKPSTRRIASLIKDRDDLPGTSSPDLVSRALRGIGTSRWQNIESLARILAEGSIAPVDVDAVVMLIHKKWVAANAATDYSRSHTLPRVHETVTSSHRSSSEGVKLAEWQRGLSSLMRQLIGSVANPVQGIDDARQIDSVKALIDDCADMTLDEIHELLAELFSESYSSGLLVAALLP
ncbi:hypothetical protein ABT061_10380 [Streptosporangium sp. NPDC002544]|uniref:hypothetical protein n=1 Tax=Streptosporangium sp. NPDC002544 TaxID=3154538 RepID=UPI00331FB9B3